MSDKKTVVITGASSGFGLLAALAFAKKDYCVIAAVRDINRRDSLLQYAAKAGCGNNIRIMQLDINDALSISRFVEGIERIDVLVNNAGFALGGFSEDVSVDEFRRQLETNFFGTVALTNALLPLMRQRRRGHIINVSSISGLVGFPGLSPYVASKHALEGWSECLRLEMADFGVWISLIEPGSYRTNIWSKGTQVAEKTQWPGSAYYETYRRIQDYIVGEQERMGNPQEVAAKIVAIAECRRPRLRYSIGKGVALLIMLKRLLPWRVWQFAVLKKFRQV